MSRKPQGWSKSQQITLHRACAAANISGQQRYIIMAHAGCPLDREKRKPSARHPANTNHQFELVMSVVESVGLSQGIRIDPPRHFPSWSDSALLRRRASLVDLAHQIEAEAIARMPGVYRVGLVDGMVRHVCTHDDRELCPIAPQSIDECDMSQVYRVVEALKSMIGRELLRRGLEPESFNPPREARARAARSSSAKAGAA